MIKDAYRQGFIDGITAYAHWRNGTKEVGTTGRTLEKAVEGVEETWNYDPPSRVTVYLVNCARCGEKHDISASPLAVPLSGYTHVGLCRRTSKPVLVTFLER